MVEKQEVGSHVTTIIYTSITNSFIEELKTPSDSKSHQISDSQVHFEQVLENFAFMRKKNDFLHLL